MLEKKTLNLTVPTELLAEFDEVCRHYGHAKQKGMVLSAAILMFLKAEPAAQGECLTELAAAQINSGVEAMIRRCRQQQSQSLSAPAPGRASQATEADRPRLAAKEAGDSVHVVTRLPTLDDLSDSARRP